MAAAETVVVEAEADNTAGGRMLSAGSLPDPRRSSSEGTHHILDDNTDSLEGRSPIPSV